MDVSQLQYLGSLCASQIFEERVRCTRMCFLKALKASRSPVISATTSLRVLCAVKVAVAVSSPACLRMGQASRRTQRQRRVAALGCLASEACSRFRIASVAPHARGRARRRKCGCISLPAGQGRNVSVRRCKAYDSFSGSLHHCLKHDSNLSTSS